MNVTMRCVKLIAESARTLPVATLLLLATWGVCGSWWAVATNRQARREVVSSAHRSAAADLHEIAHGIRRTLDQLGRLPSHVASEPGLVRSFERLSAAPPGFTPTHLAQIIDQRLSITASHWGMEQILLLGPNGRCVAAGGAGAGELTGRSFAKASIFRDALEGHDKLQYAAARKNLAAGLLFAARIQHDGENIGVVVVRAPIDDIDEWLDVPGAFVTDRRGVIVAAHDADLALRRLDRGATSAATSPGPALAQHLALAPWPGSDTLLAFGANPAPALLLSTPLALTGFGVHVLRVLPAYAHLERAGPWRVARIVGTGWGALLLLLLVIRDATARRRAARASEHQISLLTAAVEASPDGVLLVSDEGRVIIHNQLLADMWELPRSLREEVRASRWLKFFCVHLQHPNRLISTLQTLQHSPQSRLEQQLQLRDGRTVAVTATAQRLHGAVVGRVWSVRDISAELEREQELRIAAAAFESQEGIVVTNARGVVLRVNRAFEALTGYSQAELAGRKPTALRSARHEAPFYRGIRECLRQHGHWKGELWTRHKDGGAHIEQLLITAVRGRAGRITHYVGALLDISEQKAAESRVRALAYVDPLTGLGNRRMLFERLERAPFEAGSARHALVMLDLDRFKGVNDSFGHEVGDRLLREVANTLRATVRTDDMVVRLGGDEFVVLLGGLGATPRQAAQQAVEIGEKLRAALNPVLTRPEFGGNAPATLRCSASLGVTLVREESADATLNQADAAMYAAKSSGGGVRLYDSTLQRDANERRSLKLELERALEVGEFELHAQPIIDLHSGRIIKGEMLLRWRHPRRGLVAPGEFIPLAEEAGLIHPIGDWVFSESVRLAQRWHTLFPWQVAVSFNKSPLQFRREGEEDDWMDRFRAAGLGPGAMVVEITEGVLIEDVATVQARLARFRAHGIEVAIDDFGTGFSSLAYLKNLDVNYLKIDKSFIRDLAVGSGSAILVDSIIAMAHKLNLRVVAEGVETMEQRDVLVQLGCDAAQGFLFSRPLRCVEFEALVLAQCEELTALR